MKYKNFTLIELLVVVAVIAILASLLLPALLTAKQAATLSACMGQQRQQYMAVAMYAQDSADVTPIGNQHAGFSPGTSIAAYYTANDWRGMPYHGAPARHVFVGLAMTWALGYFQDWRLLQDPGYTTGLNPAIFQTRYSDPLRASNWGPAGHYSIFTYVGRNGIGGDDRYHRLSDGVRGTGPRRIDRTPINTNGSMKTNALTMCHMGNYTATNGAHNREYINITYEDGVTLKAGGLHLPYQRFFTNGWPTDFGTEAYFLGSSGWWTWANQFHKQKQ